MRICYLSKQCNLGFREEQDSTVSLIGMFETNDEMRETRVALNLPIPLALDIDYALRPKAHWLIEQHGVSTENDKPRLADSMLF
jgi:hypothetical protein